LSSTDFMPHGACFAWRPDVLALHVVSDAFTAVAYFSIPALLFWFSRRRKELPFRGVFWMFALFIISCGLTHVLAIWTIWHPDYWLDGAVKAVTALASVGTAAVMLPLMPHAIALRSPRELEAANALLATALEELAREKHIASILQHNSLPRELSQVEGLQFSASYVPADADLEIGGDWYDAVRLADGRVAVSVGDVTGSGLTAAVIMAKVRQSLRAAACIQIDPAAMLDAADRALRTEYPECIVTAFLAIIDPIERTITHAGAGHPWPILRRRDGTLIELGTPSLPLGLRDREEPGASVLQLDPGDLLVLYTDGLVEGTKDVLAGLARLRNAVACAPQSGVDLATDIRHAVAPTTVRDDIAVLTVLVLEPNHATLDRSIFESTDAHAAAASRTAIVAMLRAKQATAEDCIIAETVFSELVGNVLRYAGGVVEVVLDVAGISPVLHVFDRGPGYQYVPTLPADLYSENGRGLFLIAALTEDFHVARRLDGGSHARAVLSLHVAATRLRTAGRLAP